MIRAGPWQPLSGPHAARGPLEDPWSTVFVWHIEKCLTKCLHAPEKYSVRYFQQSSSSLFPVPSHSFFLSFILFRLFFSLTSLRGNSSNLHFFSTCLSVLLAWRSMCMRRVINEFVRVSFTVPLRPTHEPSIVEETDDFFLLLRSYRSSSTVFVQASPFSVPSIQPSANTLSLRSLTAVIMPIVVIPFLLKPNILYSANVSVTYFRI